jgi:hypothetical protein
MIAKGDKMVKARQIDCRLVAGGRFAVSIAVPLQKEPEQLQGPQSPYSLEWAHPHIIRKGMRHGKRMDWDRRRQE